MSDQAALPMPNHVDNANRTLDINRTLSLAQAAHTRLPREVRDHICSFLWDHNARKQVRYNELLFNAIHGKPLPDDLPCFVYPAIVGLPFAQETVQWAYEHLDFSRDGDSGSCVKLMLLPPDPSDTFWVLLSGYLRVFFETDCFQVGLAPRDVAISRLSVGVFGSLYNRDGVRRSLRWERDAPASLNIPETPFSLDEELAPVYTASKKNTFHLDLYVQDLFWLGKRSPPIKTQLESFVADLERGGVSVTVVECSGYGFPMSAQVKGNSVRMPAPGGVVKRVDVFNPYLAHSQSK